MITIVDLEEEENQHDHLTDLLHEPNLQNNQVYVHVKVNFRSLMTMQQNQSRYLTCHIKTGAKGNNHWNGKLQKI